MQEIIVIIIAALALWFLVRNLTRKDASTSCNCSSCPHGCPGCSPIPPGDLTNPPADD